MVFRTRLIFRTAGGKKWGKKEIAESKGGRKNGVGGGVRGSVYIDCMVTYINNVSFF